MTKVFFVMSGKGGVGNSTIAVMLSLILAEKYKTIILDLDVATPSISSKLNMKGALIKTTQGFKPVPICENLDGLSIGLSLKPHDCLVWRAPRIKLFITQCISSISDYDYAILDTPTGIKEEHLIFEGMDFSTIIVTTPQNLALNDVERTIMFCKERSMDILGIIENMSYFKCECCSKTFNPLGFGGGKEMANEYGLKLLEQLPIEPELSKHLNSGTIVKNYKNTENYIKLKNVIDQCIFQKEEKLKNDYA